VVAARDRVTIAALATFFVVVQFYTSFAALSPTPPVGYVFASRMGAALLVALLALSAIACAVRLLQDRAPLPAPSRAALVAWIGSALLASVLGLDPWSGVQVVLVMLLGAAFHVALVRYYTLPGAARTLLAAYLWTGLAASIAALGMLALRTPAALYSYNHGRAAGLFVTANQCAAYSVVLAFTALGVALSTAGRLRVLAVCTSLAALVTLAATFSQAGVLGAAVAAIFFALASGARRAAAGIAAVLALGAIVLALRPLGGHDPADTFDRLRTWRSGIRVAELFPLTGVGPMAYWRVYPSIRPPNSDPPGTFGALHPHDAYISLAGETGIVGLIAAGYGWWRIGGAIREAWRRRSPRERALSIGICAGLCAALVQGIFDTIGIVQMCFVWIPTTALALAAAEHGLPEARP
jgi:O-antigen ligase